MHRSRQCQRLPICVFWFVKYKNPKKSDCEMSWLVHTGLLRVWVWVFNIKSCFRREQNIFLFAGEYDTCTVSGGCRISVSNQFFQGSVSHKANLAVKFLRNTAFYLYSCTLYNVHVYKNSKTLFSHFNFSFLYTVAMEKDQM